METTQKITPNVQLILNERVRVCGWIPRFVRSELSAAVKAGILCKFKKEKHSPEIYFAPDAREEAEQVRNAERKREINGLIDAHITDPIEKLDLKMRVLQM
jgi:hypothetical protein